MILAVEGIGQPLLTNFSRATARWNRPRTFACWLINTMHAFVSISYRRHQTRLVLAWRVGVDLSA